MTLEELGWEIVTDRSSEKYFVYKRSDEYLHIDLDKRKIKYYVLGDNTQNSITFATLEAIRKVVIENAIY